MSGDGTLQMLFESAGVQWKIDDFFALDENGECYCSPSFWVSESEWRLSVYPNGFEDYEGWVSFDLRREDKRAFPKNFDLTFGLVKKDGASEAMVKSTWTFCKKNYIYQYSKVMKRSLLHERKSEFFSSGALTVTLTMRRNKCFDASARLDVLSDHLGNLFDSQKNSDVVLELSDGKTIPAHKSILSARSSVLATLVEPDAEGKATGIIDIMDCHLGSFEDFVRYLYTGRIESLSSCACQLYWTAKAFDVKDLQEICLDFLRRHLTLENVCDAHLIARKCGDESLKNAVQDFFNRKTKAIVGTTEWMYLLKEDCARANELLTGLKHIPEEE